ncbi:MAG: rhomboid family intramembrane serine protease [Pseudomonadota bacterium]
MSSDPAPSSPAPFFNAPAGVVGLCGLLIAAHGLRMIIPYGWQNEAFYWLALIPERLNLMVNGGGQDAYGPLSLLAAVFGHVTLHGDWMHVLLNTGMLLTLGTPVARRQGLAKFLIIFLVASAAGAAVYFALRLPDGAPAIGASGGVSGILAAAFLIMAGPRAGWPEMVSRSFLQTSLAFLALNLIIWFAGPSLFGAAIAWDAHIGGYVGGALMMAAFSGRSH